jgi:hypothetical protein
MAEDKKISELIAYTTPIDTDVLPIVDTTNSTTKKITINELRKKVTRQIYVDDYDGDDLGEKINTARAANGGNFNYSHVILPPGEQTLTTPANLTSSQFCFIDGQGTRVTIDGSEIIGFDAVGLQHSVITISLITGHATRTPKVGIFHGWTSGTYYNGDNLNIINTNFNGAYTFADFYTIDGEQIDITDCSMGNSYSTATGGFVIALSSTNAAAIASPYVTAAAGIPKVFRCSNTYIARNENKAQGVILLQGYLESIFFVGNEYRSSGEDIFIIDNTAAGTNKLDFFTVRDFTVKNNSNEDRGEATAINFITATGTASVVSTGWRFSDGRFKMTDGSPGTVGLFIKASCSDVGAYYSLFVLAIHGGINPRGCNGIDIDGYIRQSYIAVAEDTATSGNFGVINADTDISTSYIACAAPVLTSALIQSTIEVNLGGGYVNVYGLGLVEKSADPGNPVEGKAIIWMSDGTGAGDDGDIMIKIRAGGVVKTKTLVDFSAA